MSPTTFNHEECPLCHNQTLRTGGTGDGGIQYEPDVCEFCTYVQPSNKQQYEEFGFTQKCWELQVDPWCRYGLFELIDWIHHGSKGIVEVRADGITGVEELKSSIEVDQYWKQRVFEFLAEIHAEWDC